jgi:UDP-glucuronate decarboxylase
MRKTILVTGGLGFIGTNLCKNLCQQGHQVFALDNLFCCEKQNLNFLRKFKNFEWIDWDIRFNLPYDDFGRVDEVYNLACPASPPIYQKDPIYTMETNILGTLNVLKFTKFHDAKMLQASTSEVYGDPLVHPQTEQYKGNVNCVGKRSCYDEGKRAAETLCYDFHKKYKTKVKIARIFNTYGPHFNPNDGRVISNIILQALRNENITIYGDGKQTRSFCYIDDMIDGLIRLMDINDFFGPINLGNPQEFTINELSDLILRLIPDSDSLISYCEYPQDDPKQRNPDISLANSILEWQPFISLEQGLIPTIDYFRKI